MSENSKIQWTDHTFNPWIGCAKVSPGCLHCYAETQNNLRKWNPAGWGKGAPRKRTSEGNWKNPVKWNKQAAAAAEGFADSFDLTPRVNLRPRVFCASLADWLDDEVPIEWLADLLALIHATPNLDWLLLTKRPQNFRERVDAAFQHSHGEGWQSLWTQGEAPPNVWVGTTVEDQTRADERIPALLEIPARVRFLSCEPLLGPVDLVAAGQDSDGQYNPRFPVGIDWVIAGGESGPGCRPMEIEWARSLKDQCQAAGVAFFTKQLGGVSKHRGELTDFPEDLRVRQFPAA